MSLGGLTELSRTNCFMSVGDSSIRDSGSAHASLVFSLAPGLFKFRFYPPIVLVYMYAARLEPHISHTVVLFSLIAVANRDDYCPDIIVVPL